MAYRVIEVIEIVEPRRSAEPQRLFGGFAALTGLFSGLFPQFLHSGFSIIFIVGIALMAILAMVGDYVDGYSLRRSFLRLSLLGGLALTGSFLPVWLPIYYLPHHPELYDLIMPKFSAPAT